MLEGEQHVFSIPASLFSKFVSLNRAMTGEPFVPATILCILNSGVVWQQAQARNPETASVAGFAFRSMDIIDMVVVRGMGGGACLKIAQDGQERLINS